MKLIDITSNAEELAKIKLAIKLFNPQQILCAELSDADNILQYNFQQ